MNPDPSLAAPTPRHRFRWMHWLLIAVAALAVVAVLQIASLFSLVKEAADLREIVIDTTSIPMQTKVQFSVGPAILGMGRVAVSFIDEAPREAKQALAAMRRASVGVYEFDRAPTDAQQIALWEATEQRVNRDGWQRIVSVNEGSQSVMIFMPQDSDATEMLEVCVVVCEGRQLVIVSAVADSAPLMALAQEQMGDWAALKIRI